MLPLLVFAAGVCLLPGASAAFIRVTNITSCPINFYGQLYNTMYVKIKDGTGAVCFKGPYDSTDNNDCFVVRHQQANKGVFKIRQHGPLTKSTFHLNMTQLLGTTQCRVILRLRNDSKTNLINLSFRYFEKQQAVRFFMPETLNQGENVTVLVNGEEVDHWNLTGLGYSYQDVSSCRHSGVLNQPGTVTCDAKGTFINCSERAVLRAIPQQNDLCVNSAMCTVTASTVIDHHGNTTSVEDRCAYTLLSESSVRLVGVFQERRRKDVMFLDRVIIHLDDPDIDIHLGQGGRVQANSTQLNLGDSPEEHHGVDFLKDETGVTANVSHSNSSTLVFFDGYTVHIHTTHSWMLKADRKLQGLCGNHSQSLIDTKDLEFSSFSCETRFNDTVDSSINCTTVNERCELLRGWHFAGCHAYVDPEPFITACNNTLCQYPDVDGLMCQFLEAYTKACSLENQAVDGWRATANCSTTRAFCNDTLCADHEFCAEGLSGDIRCFCRAIFVSDYRSNNSLGQPVVCSANSASISLLGCLLEEIDLDYSDLHLNDDSCRGDRDTNHMVTFRFNQSSACGAEVTANNSHVVYKNNLTAEGVTSKVIDRFDQFETFDFSCFSGQPAIQSMAFKIRANSVDQQIVSESWNYNVKMTAYTDADHRHALKPDTEIQTNQIVFVELTVYGLFDNLVDLVTDSCWATPKSSPAGALRYNMITNGCSNTDETVKVQVNGKGISTHFSFHMFHFSGQGHGIYLHCKLHLCASRNVTCGPSCGGPAKRRRRRSSRSTSADESPALISLSWTN